MLTITVICIVLTELIMELNLPFSSISDAELSLLLQNNCSNDLHHNDILRDYLVKNKLLLSELDSQCVTESQFNSILGSCKDKIELSVFHLNIHTLNSKYKGLCQFLELLNVC